MAIVRWRLGRVIEVAGLAALAGLGGCGGGGHASSPDGGGGGDPGGNLSQRPSPATPLFDDTKVHDIALTMSADDWQSIIDDSRGDEWRHATVTYDGVTVEEVGVHPSGESSRFAGNVKQSFRIKFDAFNGQGKFGAYSTVNVKGEYDDGSMMRERLAMYVFNTLMPTPKTAHVRLVVNGDLRGLYTLREDWDSTSIKEHFSEPVGPLYRIRPLLPTDDPYKYVDGTPATYVPVPWEPHINKTAHGDEVVPAYLQALSMNPAPLETVADVDDLLAYLAGSIICMLTDGFVGDSGVADHFQYYDPQSNKFFILPWDPDNSFASHGETPDRYMYARFSHNTLSLIVRDQGDFRQRYLDKTAAAMAALPAGMLQAQADAIYNQIKDTAHEDPIKMFPNDTFDWNLGYIKDFITARYAYLQTQVGTN
jgi:spore coat protein CotH